MEVFLEEGIVKGVYFGMLNFVKKLAKKTIWNYVQVHTKYTFVTDFTWRCSSILKYKFAITVYTIEENNLEYHLRFNNTWELKPLECFTKFNSKCFDFNHRPLSVPIFVSFTQSQTYSKRDETECFLAYCYDLLHQYSLSDYLHPFCSKIDVRWMRFTD